ncbi:TPA: ThiF family adenylyltransferase [Pseudomonas aeruginosa]|uniref:ThiF family adenylyltransferase n=1 Tax=Pseudomonadaceae TaxID=135621 RepID=UPI000DEEAF4A|nr:MULTISPECIES: ThiF family adenylyltransferase [Pseudomonas aeruginosa group]AYK22633.1 ThiF family adenylyltransferase [Pseudomonas aeruginosa]MCE7776443.1 ThiF family adenylyltransferase [Pseudomonas aeruginosa]MCR3762510.1 ThiF family adenylyltransferase [Pseudomonas aeruginosa]MEE1951599.1 ThiF family adenylyltransferase [Pseudomonas alcaligenes]HCF2055370.1 ThiF family adenylyltransferase [Pseudomonas aeruginosa]
MSHQLISRSPQLLRLRNEGYNLEVIGSYLLVREVPYVSAQRQVCKGVLVMTLNLTADMAESPGDHTAYFIGQIPCDSQGRPLEQIINNSNQQQLLPELTVNHYFSAKPRTGNYTNYYEKVSLYVAMLSGPANALDKDVTAKTFSPIRSDAEESVFVYTDTASARAGIGMPTEKLKRLKIAIVGLGGTGAYIVDQVAKTPVAEIHLFDGDALQQHNAFRFPGAVPFSVLERGITKVEYLYEVYSEMHRHITPHACMVTADNVGELRAFDYVFLCVDNTEARKLVVKELKGTQTTLIDVGMGVHLVGETQQIWGTCRVTALTPEHHDHADRTMPLTENDAEDIYRSNIQIADLNGQNGMLAIGVWKRLCGFYSDNSQASHITYSTNLNEMGNSEERP